MHDAPPPRRATYADAGVDLDAAADALELIRHDVVSTYTPHVLQGLGAFGGLFALPDDVPDPVLVASTDGVGTKTRLGVALGRVRGLGSDLVHHCINDILVQGARPLFFLDYLASARLDPRTVADVVGGIAEACRDAGVALLGGETAEMPGVYTAGELDVVGTIVGIVSRDRIVDGSDVREGDVLLALDSGGLQTNGFSLARSVTAGRVGEPLDPDEPDGPTLGDALLAPHRCFLHQVRPLLDTGCVRALAHITGGGIPGNLPRVLPAGLGAEVDPLGWPRPRVFDRLQALGEIAEGEMRTVFNLGVGMIVVVRSEDEARVRAACPEPLHRIGRVVAGRGVRFLDRG
ncbi:MAG: phosphoribosylformylglycinamidine cyclo-ligase [bacterium]|nr:phosphoribosylformylglycinamidine cyclo-ligase [bacterium]